MERARRQRVVRGEIEDLGGSTLNHWEHEQRPKPYPAWQRGFLGDDFFDTVATVHFPHFVNGSMSDIQDADLDELAHAGIGSTQVTGEGLTHLYGLRQLESLYLTKDIRGTREGVMRLQEALPDCGILTDEPQLLSQ